MREGPDTLVRCAFCGGRGVDPFGQLSERSACGGCGGAGVTHVPIPHARCAYCQGTGSHKTYRCLVCGGAGVVTALAGPTRPCEGCAGQGWEPASRLVCLRCHGRGVRLIEQETPRVGAGSSS